MFLDIEDTIFLVIDIQEKLHPVIYNREDILKKSIIFLKSIEILQGEILGTQQYKKGLGQTLKEIKEYIEDKNMYDKNSFSAYNGELKEYLNNQNKKNIVIIGMETHICVFQTARDLIINGYNVYIVKDLVGSRSLENYNNALYLLDKLGCIITNMETVLFDLLRTSESEKFKQILKLIK